MEAYFDNSATTRVCAEAAEIVLRTMTEEYGNPSAMHSKGVEAEQYVRKAAEILAGILKVQPKEILFTSGGTESDNLALIGGALANQRAGRHIIMTAVEHPAVTGPAAFLEEQGFEVTYLPVDQQGVVRLDALRDALREDTILVSVMMVNNETGSRMPVEEIAETVHRKNPKILFHVDAIQAFGKYRIFPSRMGIDLLSVSSHKFHGPKGAGFLYIRNGVKIRPLILGGGQQNGMRSGTDNVPGIAGMAAAAQKVCGNLEENAARLLQLKKRMAEGLLLIPGVRINGMALEEGAPHILSVTVEGVRSEVLLHTLEEKNIYVSAGSACSSHKRRPSAVLTAMGLSKSDIESTVRISFSEENTIEEVDYALQVLREVVPVLRRFARR